MNDPAKKNASKLAKLLFNRNNANPYAVLDGASVDGLLALLAEHNAEYICLYRGEIDQDLAEVAPYLIRLEEESPLTEAIFQGWGQHWGIFALSPYDDMRLLRKHFRSFLMVYSPERKPLYFRYYDPRVLRVYLPTCNEEDNDVMFAYVDEYFMEDEDSAFIRQFVFKENVLQQQQIAL